MADLSIIVASSGRPTLERTVDSILSQLRPCDELVIDVNNDSPWGHNARNRQMKRCKGDFLMFLDDDDVYVDGALETVRSYCDDGPSDFMHIFKMRYANGRELWQSPQVQMGNVSTQMIAVPNRYLGRWGDRYEGDFDFISSTVTLIGEPIWHSEVIALVRPDG